LCPHAFVLTASSPLRNLTFILSYPPYSASKLKWLLLAMAKSPAGPLRRFVTHSPLVKLVLVGLLAYAFMQRAALFPSWFK
jgi:hypothetical protein